MMKCILKRDGCSRATGCRLLAVLTCALALVVADASLAQTTLKRGEFEVRWWVLDPTPPPGKWVEGRVAWSTDQNVLFWAFDRQNPEAMLKVLDGRSINGHWWGDYAVMTDLRTWMSVRNRRTGDEWIVETARVHQWFRSSRGDNRRLVCAWPRRNESRINGYQCVFGAGLSSREAYDRRGTIPRKFWTERVVGYLE